MVERQTCGNCTWFKAEPNILIDDASPVIQEDRKRDFGVRDGGSRQPIYGRCRAAFQDANNETREYDFGALSSSTCRAKDDSGHKLFRIG